MQPTTDDESRETTTDRPIVRRVGTEPDQRTFPPPSFDKVRPGDDLEFDAHVNIEQVDDGRYLKKATIFSNVPNGGTWEVISDEGTAIGGEGSAPSPLMYFAVGMGFCLMSHVEIVAEQLDVDLAEARLEQRSSFATTYTLGDIHPREIFGHGETQEFHLVLEADASEEEMVEFAGWCRQACMALQTVEGGAPVVTELHLNGNQIPIPSS
jgi:uncharacterized OsmC-like protein